MQDVTGEMFRMGVSSCQVRVARPHCPQMSLLSPATAAATWGLGGGWGCGVRAGPEHMSEAQREFAVEPEPLNCSRCFAATQQFVIKTQLAILIRLSI